ncbi:M48 protein [Murid betaherpesvirus 1]|nr:M48 protein [Murid betaherpesvirus 1]WEG71711.1 large tegument protein [Murid betaherpesvirus 1]CAJ1013272.1 M48 protein [Murid betaherpesvirus 1]CAJ1013440.1 M48 protein [Murid betaherpesvirus 1]DBA07333.1 TPA_asm: M48 [Murid betaherpesvirus 1]
MKIVRASRDQSAPVYGPRAGSQCMSNCFTFLHTCYLMGIDPVLDTTSLDAVLDSGARLDAIADEKVKRQALTDHPYRLGTEIPTVIETPAGITGHALSRPFNGTAETQDLGGYKCLGILDFLTYARGKPLPVYIIVTVGVHTRGVIVARGATYVFDPHTTDLSAEAAVYVCDDFTEAISALSFFGAMIGDFYYDAVLVYFTRCRTTLISPSELLVQIMDQYKDPDIDASVMSGSGGGGGGPSISSSAASASASVSPLPSGAASDGVTNGAGAQTSSKSGKKRRAPDVPPQQKGTAKTLRRSRRPIRLPERLSEVIVEDVQTIEHFRTATQSLPVKPPQEWTMYCGEEPFYRQYFVDVGRQLLAHAIDTYVSLDKTTDESAVQRFESLMGLSDELDAVIAAARATELSAPPLYKTYLSQRVSASAVTRTDRLLASKILALFEEGSATDFETVSSWLRELLQQLPVENTTTTEAKIAAFVAQHPIPGERAFVCLRNSQVKSLGELLSVKRETLKVKYMENDATYRKILDAISKLGLASNAAAAIQSADTSHLDSEQLASLAQAAEAYAQSAYESCQAKMTELLSTNHNRILTGSLPDSDIAAVLAAFKAVSENVRALREVELLKSQVHVQLAQLTEDLLYLQTAEVKLEVTPSAEIKKLRAEYETARKQISDEEMRIKELIENMEDMITDSSSSPPPPEMLDMLRTQIEEVESMTVDEQDARRADKVLGKLSTLDEAEAKATEFAQSLSTVNIPSLNEIKGVKMLKSVLETNADLRRAYVQAVTGMLENALKQLAEGNLPSDDMMSRITALAEQLPTGRQVRADLLDSTDIVSQMSRRLRYAANQKNSTQSLEDVLNFFSENDDMIRKLLKTSWGKPVATVYRRVQVEYDRKMEELRESEWLKRVKETDIDSPQTLERLLKTAPNETILAKHAPDMHARLKKRMQSEAEKRTADMKRLYEEMRKKVDTDLKVVSDSFSSQTPSVFSSIDLKSCGTSLVRLTKEDRKAAIATFNANLTKSLNSLLASLVTVETATIAAILKGADPEATSSTGSGGGGADRQKHTSTLENNISTLLGWQQKVLLPETERDLLTIAHLLTALTHMRKNWRNPAAAFSSTPHTAAYRNFAELANEIESRRTETLARYKSKYAELNASIHDNTKANDVTIKPEDTFTAAFRDTVKAMAAPFSTELQARLQARENELKDELSDLNVKLKTKLERYLAKRSSQDARWRDLITQHRIRLPEGLDVDTNRLRTDTVVTLNGIIRSAATTLPYITAKRGLEWTTEFILAAIEEKKDADPGMFAQLATLLDNSQAIARKIEEKIVYNTKVEAEMLETAPEHTRESLSNLQLMLGQLEAKRVVGGEARYKILSDAILTKQNKLAFAEDLEKLSARYFELARDIRSSKYGLDFDAQLLKTSLLKSEIGQHKKDPPSTGEEVGLPEESTTAAKISISSLLLGIAALEKYIVAHRTLLDNFVSSQPLISQAENIPALVGGPGEDDKPGQEPFDWTRIDLSRLSACDVSTALYRGTDVFGERRVMTARGIQLYLYATHGNFVFEAFSHVRGTKGLLSSSSGGGNGSGASSRQKDQQNATVTRRYRSVTVLASIAATLQTFWSEISRYDIRELLVESGRDPESAADQRDRRLNTVMNLKLFVYVMTVAWSEATPPVEPGSPEATHALEVSLLDFSTLMAALHPEYVYAITTQPVDATLRGLIARLDRRTVDAAMNTQENPPPYDMRELKAFCLDTKQWTQEDIRPQMWMSDLVKQICTSHPRNRDASTSTKLFLYMLATKVLPRDILRCLWVQFRPAYASSIASLEELVSALCDSFFRIYGTTSETVSARLKTGEKVERQVVLRHKPTMSLLDEFSQQEAVLDYILGSYVFAIPMTVGIHVTNIVNGRYRLIVRHLENLPSDPDFVKVVRSRDLSFDRFGWSYTVQNPVERSWFSLQEDRLRHLLTNPPQQDRTPLVVYDSNTNYAVNAMMPPLKAPPAASRVHLTVKNPFSTMRMIPHEDEGDDAATSETPFTSLPINIDFLRRDPPRLKRASGDSSSSVPAEDRDPDARPQDSVPDQSLSEPLFSQTKVSSIVPKDAVTTLSNESISQTFQIHPFRALSSAIMAAIEILQETRLQLDTFESDMCEAIRRIKILYLH